MIATKIPFSTSFCRVFDLKFNILPRQDIRQQRLHRQRRGAELQKLRQTLGSLQAKSSFHSEQVDYYRDYITSCLDNLTTNR